MSGRIFHFQRILLKRVEQFILTQCMSKTPNTIFLSVSGITTLLAFQVVQFICCKV